MANTGYSGATLAILGGGQLGRMMLQACMNYNIRPLVLDPDPEAPCSYYSGAFTCGSFKDYQTVLDFAKDADIVTVEIEHVNADALDELERQGKSVYPQPEIIRMVQDKGLQKQFYLENNIPTSEFILLESEKDLVNHINFLPAFQKSRLAGYDGRGVKGMFLPNDLEEALEGPCLLERKVDYDKEISVIVARNTLGEITTFPPVELVFHPEKNLLDYLASPAGLELDVEEKATFIASMVAKKLGIVGVLAVEMFVTPSGDVLVNEIAPRPHNSGHQTIEANITSQYEQHLRAILGLPLGDTTALQPSLMINLLGEPAYEGPAIYQGMDKALKIPGVYVHLYGKTHTRPFRKMGHVTITGKDWGEVHEKTEKVKNLLKVIA
jgi:5-(carboxyamino)imidazole ribonucleotide synthase